MKQQILFIASLMIFSGFFTACSTMSNLAEEDNVKVSRDEPSKDCEFLDKLEGRSLTRTAKQEDALKDLRQEAANKGANYLVVKEYSGVGTAVTGLAYKCP
ncbi:MAG: hypothetical protein A2Z20_12395 [Bdellovibrionales bacterium RBG_16_40_8]|nr:MAG: hypothetical protein A2Z20_12395 [Bdellovibrionales bacterium RBG_16_40_8]